MAPAANQSFPSARPFYVADLNARGERLSEAEYTYAVLEQVPYAAELIVACATRIWQSPQEFELNLPCADSIGIDVRWWACANGAGMLSVRYAGQIASLSLLASGLDPAGDDQTMRVFQQHLLRELHDTGSEAAFDLLDLHRRPLVATTLLIPPSSQIPQFRVALLDRCFGAAFFRYHNLV